MFHIKPKLTAINLNCNIGEAFLFLCLFCEGEMVVYHYRTMLAGHTKGDKFSQYYKAKWEVLLMIFLMILQIHAQHKVSNKSLETILLTWSGNEPRLN